MKHTYRMAITAIATAILALSAHTVKAQWDSCGPGGGRVLALCASGSNIFAGTADSGVYLSTNNGSSWTMVNSGFTYLGLSYLEIYSLAASRGTLFAGTARNGVFLSTNNGTSWTAVDSRLSYQGVTSFTLSGNNIFAGTGGGVFLSTDNGTNWTAVDSGLGVSSLAARGSDIFAGTGNGGIFLSTNNGANWKEVNSGLSKNMEVIYSLAVSGSTIYAGTFRGVFFSADNGTSWTTADSGLTNTTIGSLVVSGNNIFAGTYSSVFLSTNNGTIWKAVNSGLSNPAIYSLLVSGSNIFAGTWGSGVWRRPLTDFAGTIDNTARRLSYPTSFKIFFPGSTGSTAAIAFSLARRERVKFTVFNISGYAILSLADKQFDSGPQTLLWDTKSLAPGCYVVKMQTQTSTCAKNFTLIR